MSLRASLSKPGDTSGPDPAENGGGSVPGSLTPFCFGPSFSTAFKLPGPSLKSGKALVFTMRAWVSCWLMPACVSSIPHALLVHGCPWPSPCWSVEHAEVFGLCELSGLPSLPPDATSDHQTLTHLAVPSSSVISSRKAPETLFLWALAKFCLYVCCGQESFLQYLTTEEVQAPTNQNGWCQSQAGIYSWLLGSGDVRWSRGGGTGHGGVAVPHMPAEFRLA